MKIITVVLLSFIVTFLSCNNQNQNNNSPSNKSDTATFFDVQSFFQNEIKQVQATPYFIYSILTNRYQQKDSSVISNRNFAAIANEFTQFNIRSKEISSFYSENAFNDLSTKSVTLSYSTSNESLPIKSIDVLLDDEKNTVKRVFVKTIQDKADSSIIQQFSWKAGKSFLIVTTVLKKDGTKYSTQQYVNWNE